MTQHNTFARIRFGVIALSLVAAACSPQAVPTIAPTAVPATSAPAASSVDPAAALKELETTVYSTGPHGESPASAADVVLTDDEVAQVKGMQATAAIVLHYGGNDWSTAQVAGLQAEFARLGIEVIAVTDANFQPQKQVSDLETVMAKNPDIIVSIPTDPVATADAFKKAAEAGIKLVFMDNVPNDMTAGTDYVSVVSADNYGNGVASALIAAQKMGGQGKIGLIYHGADFFVTKQRYDGFKKTLTDSFPGIQVVAEQGIGGPDFAGDAEKAASAMLTKYPDLTAIWAVWDVPAAGVLAAIRSSGRTDVQVFTQDLGKDVAVELAKNGNIVGLGAQRPFDQGVTEARLAAYALLGKPAPAYVALYALPVTHENVLEAWQAVYHADPPVDLVEAYVK